MQDGALAGYRWPIRSFVEDLEAATLENTAAGLPDEVTARSVHPVLERVIGALSELPRQRIHGDCGHGNVLLRRVPDGAAVVGFIDLDHLSYGSRVYDLAKYLASRINAVMRDPGEADGTGPAATAFRGLVGHYVAGYHAVYPLSERELAAVVPMIHAVEVGGASWSRRILSGWQGRDRTGHAESYRAACLALRWLVDHFDALAADVGDVLGAGEGQESK